MKHNIVTRLVQAVVLTFALAHCGDATPLESAPATQSTTSARALEAPSTTRSFVPGQVIVKFRAGGKAGKPAGPLSVGGFTAQPIRPIREGVELWSLQPASVLETSSIAEEEALTRAAIDELRKRPDVEYAHENLLMELFATPNDEHYWRQWHYPAINMPRTWDFVTGNVKIAVLDSGKLPHPDLDGRWLPGYDFGDGDSDPTDTGTWHHGTHVAGILAARTGNGIGGAGICWGCSLIPVKVFSSAGELDLLRVDEAIHFAIQQGARVINMSFGSKYTNSPCSGYQLLQSAVDAALAANIVVVAAAGNESWPTAQVTPASCTGVIAVGASDQNGQKALYSNTGSRVDITAPGGGGFDNSMYGIGLGCPVNSGWGYADTLGAVSSWAMEKPASQLLPGDYCYRYLSGTSMAAPHVAGVAALILSQRPAWTAAQVTQRILQSARPITSCPNDCGVGLIDASRAIVTPLGANGFNCLSGSGTFWCEGSVDGGVAPFTHTWTAVSNTTVTMQNGPNVWGTCTPNGVVRHTVRDSENTTAFGDMTLPCPPPFRDAAFVQQSAVPASVLVGTPFTVSVTMRNTGSQAWTSATGFKLLSQNHQGNTTWGVSRVELASGESIQPGQEKTFTFNVTAPATPGTYDFQWRMFQEGVESFGQPSQNVSVSVQLPPRAAAFVRQSVPGPMGAGWGYSVSVTMRNTGSATWTAASGFKLGSLNPPDNTTWGLNRVELAPNEAIATGQEKTFTFAITAPTTAGPYNFSWGMLQDGAGFFGTPSPNVSVSVVLPPREAVFVRQTVPASVRAGEAFTVSVTMRNTGSMSWSRSAGFKLSSQNPTDNTTWGLNRVELDPNEVIATGQEKTFVFTATAPGTEGSWPFQWRMLQEGLTPFGQLTPNVIITVLPPTVNASFVMQDVPARVTAGRSFQVSVTMKNIGEKSWSRSSGYRLAGQVTDWGDISADLDGRDLIHPGSEKTFYITVFAPSAPGTYPVQWRMWVPGPGGFGQLTPRTNIVVDPACPPCPPGQQCPDVLCEEPM
ncbi:S8 family serine peptidase [Pyxidicoccus sp. MSG2]|uniref:S8 family serine peptidase n=1 Tax=Pyxidicoccus sp. MSG2 TaxID=2996790 RepID=UPI00226DCBAA|nr:S8 family serine peptidase [Pyxidicoccus sp. MSG2]MCY1020057.1 S8 family serine peptidase [Pyxidicoccus sp. MSG2]